MQTRPGELTVFENIPHALRAHAQFILYRVIPHNGKLLKLPYSAHAPNAGAIDPLDPTHWTTFEHAVLTCLQFVAGGFGIGFVLTPQAGITCFDLDNRDDPAAYEAAVTAMSVEPHKTWCETSVSGNGRHYFYLGNTPDGTSSMNDVHPGIEIYCSKRFIALTGNLLPESLPDLTGGDNIVQNIYAIREEKRKERIAAAGTSPLTGVTYELGRGHMSNERALLLMSERKPLSYGHLWQAAPQGTGSERIMQVVGDLDKILADPEQIYQIIEGTPLGQSRCNSLYRKFHKYWLPDARKSNDQGIWNRTQEEQAYFIERGKEMTIAFAQRERVEQEARDVYDFENAKAVVQADQSSDRFSPLVVKALTDITEGMDRRYLTKDLLPPGLFGDLCREIEYNMYKPFRKFAIAAALPILSAMCGRWAKIERRESGLNVFMLLCAKTGTGKTSAYEAAEDVLNLLREVDNGAGEQIVIPKYLKNMFGATRQGLHRDFEAQPSICLISDECSQVLEASVRGRDGSASLDLANTINQLYDASKRYKFFEPPNSARSKKEGEGAIINLNASLFWGTTVDNLRRIMTKSMIETGLAPRMVMVVHDMAGGKHDRNHKRRPLPQDVAAHLRLIIQNDINVAQAYAVARNPETNVPHPPHREELSNLIKSIRMTREAEDLFYLIHDRTEAMVDAVNDGDSQYSETFKAFNRVVATAERIAGTIAVFNNPVAPIIGITDMSWAFGYVLQAAGELVTAVDRGDIAAEFGDEETVVIDVYRKLLAKQPKNEPWVPRFELRKYAKMRTPFYASAQQGRMLDEAVRNLVMNGILIEEVVEPTESYIRRKAVIYKPTDHAVWHTT